MVAEKRKNDRLNLSEFSPEEIARRVLETPPPPERQEAKERKKRRRLPQVARP